MKRKKQRKTKTTKTNNKNTLKQNSTKHYEVIKKILTTVKFEKIVVKKKKLKIWY